MEDPTLGAFVLAASLRRSPPQTPWAEAGGISGQPVTVLSHRAVLATTSIFIEQGTRKEGGSKVAAVASVAWAGHGLRAPGAGVALLAGTGLGTWLPDLWAVLTVPCAPAVDSQSPPRPCAPLRLRLAAFHM